MEERLQKSCSRFQKFKVFELNENRCQLAKSSTRAQRTEFALKTFSDLTRNDIN